MCVIDRIFQCECVCERACEREIKCVCLCVCVCVCACVCVEETIPKLERESARERERVCDREIKCLRAGLCRQGENAIPQPFNWEVFMQLPISVFGFLIILCMSNKTKLQENKQYLETSPPSRKKKL